MRYIINGLGYFFAVEDDVARLLDDSKLVGCEFPPTKQAMYESIMQRENMDLDEIEAGELVIKYRYQGANGTPYQLVCVEPRGLIDHIEDSVEYQRGGLEEYINDYVL